MIKITMRNSVGALLEERRVKTPAEAAKAAAAMLRLAGQMYPGDTLSFDTVGARAEVPA